MAFDQFGFPDISDGPDRFRGGAACPDHHNGTREGISDWCCCCNPCLYERSSFSDDHQMGVSPWDLRGSCCRCYPKAICLLFSPDAPPSSDCCEEFVYTAFPEHFPEYTKYTFSFRGTEIVISIDPSMDYEISSEFNLGPCYWSLNWAEEGVSESVQIDHTNVTCLMPPEWAISGVTDSSGCTGSISFVPYQGSKIPFTNAIWDSPRQDDIAVADSPCNCDSVPQSLCVNGIRKADDEVGHVVFSWDEDLEDRWTYFPPCGNPATDKEHIYLRSDGHGNCYLELDFEQGGSYTNDWADPQNTFDLENPTEIRDGMLPMNSCSCGLYIKAESSGNRSIAITSGPCSRFAYACEECRCVPQTMCVFGEIDGVLITEGVVAWSEAEASWIGTVAGFNLAISIAAGSCEECESGTCDRCVGTIDNTPFVTPFENGKAPLSCGPFTAFELASKYDENNPDKYNWLWVSAGVCGCIKQKCGICAEERCGGPPATLYYEYRGERPPVPPDPYPVTCSYDVTLHYWERWTIAGPLPVLECGYFGQTAVVCDDTTYIYAVEIPPSRVIRISRTDLKTGEIAAHNSYTFDPQSCDPLVYSSPVDGQASPLCGCGIIGITESEIVITE